MLNKTLPDSLLDPAGAAAATALHRRRRAARRRARRRRATPRSPTATRTARVLRTVGESYRNFSVVAMREAELRAELARVPDVVARVPTFDDDISDVDGLDRDLRATSYRGPTGAA